jgi:hypothetical protein
MYIKMEETLRYFAAMIVPVGLAYACKPKFWLTRTHTLRYHSDHEDYPVLCQYICDQFPKAIIDFHYEEELVYNFTEWRRKQKEKPATLKVLTPHTCDFIVQFIYKDSTIPVRVKIDYIRDTRGDIVKKIEPSDCSQEELLMKELTLSCKIPEALVDFVDAGKTHIQDIYKECRAKTKDTICIYYYKKDYWTLFSKSPKRSIDTIYLKENEGEKLLAQVKEFFSEDMRDTYLRYGIPYKNVSLIYGPPGTGKTSLIKSVASELDCDIFVLAISKDMLDTHLVEAFNYINDREDTNRIIVMEDVDTLFDDRKEGDKNNGITMQAFLNCLDGFTCVEGTMLFMTANKPEVFDQAMIRSCRIDHKLKLDYADKYQTLKMYTTFFPDQFATNFTQFYKKIKHLKYTTAMLQEFMFYNRSCESIIDKLPEFLEIVENNNPKNYEILKEGSRDLYM